MYACSICETAERAASLESNDERESFSGILSLLKISNSLSIGFGGPSRTRLRFLARLPSSWSVLVESVIGALEAMIYERVVLEVRYAILTAG